VGTAGGVLVGFRNHKFDILQRDINQYCVSTLIKNICDGFIWRLVTVYGLAYDDHKQEFITELPSVMSNWDGPTLCSGDFNLILALALRETMVVLITTGLNPLMTGSTIGG
jgi:hypothetical protein